MESLLSIVQALEGQSDRRRGRIIREILDARGLAYDLQPYREWFFPTDNIVVTKPGASAREILVLSHYDVYHGLYDAYHANPGANDNASSIAVALDIIQRLANVPTHCTIKAIFFDDEEISLFRPIPCFGSRQYVKRHGIEQVAGVFCLEMCGMGDRLVAWPVSATARQRSTLLATLARAAAARAAELDYLPPTPGFTSDFQPFRAAGLAEAFCISAYPSRDRERLLGLFSASVLTLAFWASIPKMLRITGHLPEMLRYYHTKHDRAVHLSENALRMTADTLYDALLDYDAQVRHGAVEAPLPRDRSP